MDVRRDKEAGEGGGAGSGTAENLPMGAAEATWFQLFNALSWQISLGAPAIVYAKSLGATSTVLGVMAALTPLLTIFQLPATHLLPRYGYKRFLLAGWGSRTVVIFLMAAVPMMAWAPRTVRLWALMGLLLAFNVLRGIASGAWWPWISELIPPHQRGRYLSREQVFMQAGALSAMAIAAVTLGGDARPWQFALVFLTSALAQTVSLLFITRIPEASAEERVRQSGHRVPWKEIVTWPPFLRLVTFNVIYQAAIAGVGVFTVSFMRGQAGYSESAVMVLAGVAIVGALSTVTWVGRLVDREGSRLVLRVCLGAFVLILLGWWLAASGVAEPGVPLVAGLQLAMGVAGVNFGVANNRLTMGTIPLMGRNHFFAAYSVIVNLAMGLSPIIWGVVLDSIGDRAGMTGPAEWNRYSIYFAAVAVVTLLALGYTALLKEGDGARR